MSATDDVDAAESRLHNEISLLEAMYPDQILWNPHSREIKIIDLSANTSEEAASGSTAISTMVLRLPDDYLEEVGSLPIVISAQDNKKQDLRQAITSRLSQSGMPKGEEVLDQVVMIFQDLLISPDDTGNTQAPSNSSHTVVQIHDVKAPPARYKTVVIWLHHLLATGKRKLALNPSCGASGKSNTDSISGLTKPGYPGIMAFSGPSYLVDDHVSELRSQRWQAFQVRLEEDHDVDAESRWAFTHGSGIREVETMSEIVSGIVGKQNQDQFLAAVGVR